MTRKKKMRGGFFWMVAAILFLAIFSAGCADEGELATPEIAGTYTDQYGDTHEITADYWAIYSPWGDSIVYIRQVDNQNNFIRGFNDLTVSYNPGKKSHLDWTYYGVNIYMCTTAFDAETYAELFDAESDATDPTTGGCDVSANFPWTNLTP
ncbi:MAG: hypothetical protein IIC13_01680 [SAR324 cluster bacterium]|nr:hypothetical protein [SAR324 cluster bacterium]